MIQGGEQEADVPCLLLPTPRPPPGGDGRYGNGNKELQGDRKDSDGGQNPPGGEGGDDVLRCSSMVPPPLRSQWRRIAGGRGPPSLPEGNGSQDGGRVVWSCCTCRDPLVCHKFLGRWVRLLAEEDRFATRGAGIGGLGHVMVGYAVLPQPSAAVTLLGGGGGPDGAQQRGWGSTPMPAGGSPSGAWATTAMAATATVRRHQ